MRAGLQHLITDVRIFDGRHAELKSGHVLVEGELISKISSSPIKAPEGATVIEKVLTFEDAHNADEIFLSGNMNKVTPVTEFDGTNYQVGPVTRRVREMYWDWAASETA